MIYNVRPIHCYSPSDFVVRNWDREEKLKNELDEIFQEQPAWLRMKIEDAHKMTPIDYVDSEYQTGREYVIMHETSPEFDLGQFHYLS